MLDAGGLDERRFLAFYLNEGRLDAVVAMNRGKDVRRAMPLIKARTIVDPALLENEDADLRPLVTGVPPGGS